MGHRDIPTAAVAAGTPAYAHLARAIRDNILLLDHYRQAVAAQLEEATGHPHGTGTVSTDYNFSDRIETVAGENDQLDFRFGGGAVAAADHTLTLDAGVRTPAAFAAHVQVKMRAAASATTDITVGYDTDPESESRGLFYQQHTGSSDTPNARVFALLYASGAGEARSAAPSMGFSKFDYRGGGYSFVGESGFADSFVQDTVPVGDGGLLDSDGFVDEAFTTPKFADEVFETRTFQNGSVGGSGGGNKIQSNSITGPKLGAPFESTTHNLGGGATTTVTVSTGGATRPPMCTPVNLDGTGVSQEDLEIISRTFVSGINWNVVLKVLGPARNVRIVAY